MKNTKLKISVSLVLILTFLIIPAQSDLPNHIPVICFDCHTDGKYSYNEEGDECGDCHKYTDLQNKIVLNRLEEYHNPNTCKACHDVKDSKAFHTLHRNVPDSCARCHGSYGNAIPDRTISECAGCHGGQVHIIHQDNLTGVCSKCHGRNPKFVPSGQSLISTNKLTSGVYAKVVDYKQYTLLEVIKRLFGW